MLLVNVLYAKNIDECKMFNGNEIMYIEELDKDSLLLTFSSSKQTVFIVKWNKKTNSYYYTTWAPEDAKFQAISNKRIIYSHSSNSIMFQCKKSYKK